ncbi:MAG: response regulator [Anaerolineae bacterium]|nr:response regulator [Anaerolineae bacterium]
MPTVRDRILVVENDPVTADLIGRQALQAMGFQVTIVGDATNAISKAIQWLPDLILCNINLPSLSGKDLLVALQSQGMHTPVVMLAQRGQEADIVQAFRLGAADYLLLPVREAEVISAVERVLKQVHERRERERLSQQLQVTNQELQQRVRELTTVFSVGKAVTSITDLSLLMDRILEGAVRVSQADMGWFLMRDDDSKPFVLVAEINLPGSLGLRIGQPWDDGMSKLVAMSGETLTITGEPLKRFKIAALGQAALVAPIRAQKRQQRAVIGLLALMRKSTTAFGASESHLLEALADYASIALVNASVFRSAEERARSLQGAVEGAQFSERINADLLLAVKHEITPPVETAGAALVKLGKDPTARWRPDQRQLLASIQDQLDKLRQLSEAINPPPQALPATRAAQANLNELLRQSVRRLQALGSGSGVSISADLPGEAILAAVDPQQVGQVLDGLITLSVRSCASNCQLFLFLEKSELLAHVALRVPGQMMTSQEMERFFEPSNLPAAIAAAYFRGLTSRPARMKEILARQGGKIWLESQAGKGTVYHISLPLAR